MQIEDILIKISSNEKFLYIIKEQNLDPDLYSKLLNETYDELKMDKINVNRLEENFDLLAMVDYTPFGINEPETSTGKPRPMFGHTDIPVTQWVPTNTPGTCYIWQTYWVTHYYFWIGDGGHWGNDVPDSGHYGPCP